MSECLKQGCFQSDNTKRGCQEHGKLLKYLRHTYTTSKCAVRNPWKRTLAEDPCKAVTKSSSSNKLTQSHNSACINFNFVYSKQTRNYRELGIQITHHSRITLSTVKSGSYYNVVWRNPLEWRMYIVFKNWLSCEISEHHQHHHRSIINIEKQMKKHPSTCSSTLFAMQLSTLHFAGSPGFGGVEYQCVACYLFFITLGCGVMQG